MVERHMVVLGGGGFLMDSDRSLLDDFVLSLARSQRPRVCFIPTASADAATSLVLFYRAFAGRACIPTDLTLFGSPALPRRPASTSDLAEFVAAQDVFYVGGGNTVNLLALWRAHGLDQLLRQAWMAGAVLSGVSAGMICWFRASVTDSFGKLAALNDGLGLLEGSACPHYDSEPERRPTYQQLIAGGFPGGYALDDGAALHFTGVDVKEAVSSRQNAGAYRVALSGGQVVEERLSVRWLGTSAEASSKD